LCITNKEYLGLLLVISKSIFVFVKKRKISYDKKLIGFSYFARRKKRKQGVR
jgi:hypothetical protein